MPLRRRAGLSHSGRFLLLATAIVLTILAYSAAWHYAARALETRAAQVIDSLNGDRRRASCENLAAHGYPFRIGLFCNGVFFEDAGEGVSLSAGAFRSAAQIYQPARVVGELDGPARIALPLLRPLKAQWEILQLSARLTEALPQRVSGEAGNVSVGFEEPEGTPVLTAAMLQAHARQNGPDADLALLAEGLQIAPSAANGAVLPPLDAELLVSVAGGVALLEAPVPRLRGMQGNIRNLTLRAAGQNAALAVRGPVKIGLDGLVDAQLEVALTEPRTIARLAGEALPGWRERIASVSAGLAALGPAPSFPVNIRRGKVFVGFIPVGEIPPVR